jgi:N-acetylglucosaminyl-diphospho-decaprenol L-rhamnosyltransferase
MNDQVAILIVGYDCAVEIRNCLQALTHSTYAAFEVHICENGGPDGYRQLISEVGTIAALSPDQRTVTGSEALIEARDGQLSSGQKVSVHRASDNLGYAGGLNALLDTIEQDRGWSAVWILNPDTTIHPDALLGLVAYSRDSRYGIIGSRLVSAATGRIEVYAGRWRKWMARGFNMGWGQPGDEVPDVAAIERDMNYVPGAAMYVTRAYIEQVGRMDERYFLYNEEIDWCFRKGEYRLGYAHASVVYHQHGATIGSSHDKRGRSRLSVYLDERNKLLFTRRFYPIIYLVVMLVTLGLTAQYLLAGAYANFQIALKGWYDGLLGRDGRPDWLLPHRPSSASSVGGKAPEIQDSIPAGRDHAI